MASRTPSAWTSQVDTFAWRATAVKVMGVPSASIASIACVTRVRRSWLSRRRAAIIASAARPSRVTAAPAGGASLTQDPAGFFDLGAFLGRQGVERVVHRRGDLAEGGDLFVEVAHDERVDVHRGGGFPVGLERGEVFFDGG